MNPVQTFLAAVCLAVLTAAAPLWAATDFADRQSGSADGERAARAVQEVMGDRRLQTEMPMDLGPARGRSSDRNYGPGEVPPPKKRWQLDLGPLNLVFRVLFWGAIIAVAFIVVKALLDNRWNDGRRPELIRPEPDEDTGPDPATGARLDSARMNADELARRGDFAGAMHVLLLQSVAEMRRRLGLSIAASLTSREIHQRLKLTPQERGAFGDIVGRVELTHFGGRQPGFPDYEACRRSFETLSLALRRGAPA